MIVFAYPCTVMVTAPYFYITCATSVRLFLLVGCSCDRGYCDVSNDPKCDCIRQVHHTFNGDVVSEW